MRVAFAIVVVDIHEGDEIIRLDDKVNRLSGAFGGAQSCFDCIGRIDCPVHRENLFSGREAGFVSRSAEAHVDEVALVADAQAENQKLEPPPCAA